MLSKIIKIFIACMVLALLNIKLADKLAVNQADIARATSPETTTSLVKVVESLHQLAKSGKSSFLPPLSSRELIWQHLYFPILPPPRIGSSLILNPINKIGLMFGGLNLSVGELNDLWLTNGLSWIQFHTPHSPEPRSDASMTYDELSQMTILFGGKNNGILLGDTWIFNGVDWNQQYSPISPNPRANAGMAYDADRNTTILFGGQTDTGKNYWEPVSDMWTWDGEKWQQQFPTSLPPTRWGANIVYDRTHKSIVLFSGASVGGFWEDTWLWDGSSWIEQHPLHHPVGRANFGITYDESRQQVILFGGQTYAYADATETWAWDGQDWMHLPIRQTPPEELAYGAQLVYMPDIHTTMLYNAFREKTVISEEDLTFVESSEVWALAYINAIYLPIICGQ